MSNLHRLTFLTFNKGLDSNLVNKILSLWNKQASEKVIVLLKNWECSDLSTDYINGEITQKNSSHCNYLHYNKQQSHD